MGDHLLQDLDVVCLVRHLLLLQDKMDGIHLQDLVEDFIKMVMGGKDKEKIYENI
jgi:hypothetical protein